MQIGAERYAGLERGGSEGFKKSGASKGQLFRVRCSYRTPIKSLPKTKNRNWSNEFELLRFHLSGKTLAKVGTAPSELVSVVG